jgi:hypothetical protein
VIAWIATDNSDGGPLAFDHDFVAIAEGYERLGYEVKALRTTINPHQTRPVDMGGVTAETPVVGDLRLLPRLVTALGGRWEPMPSWPEQLRYYMRRDLSEIRAEDAIDRILNGERLFLKLDHKWLPGAIYDLGNVEALMNIHEGTLLMRSEIVDFAAEWRIFYDEHGEVEHMAQYRGEAHPIGDAHFEHVRSAGKAFGRAPAGLSIDFGVTRGWHLRVVEAHAGPALGLYGLPPLLAAQRHLRAWRACFEVAP